MQGDKQCRALRAAGLAMVEAEQPTKADRRGFGKSDSKRGAAAARACAGWNRGGWNRGGWDRGGWDRGGPGTLPAEPHRAMISLMICAVP